MATNWSRRSWGTHYRALFRVKTGLLGTATSLLSTAHGSAAAGRRADPSRLAAGRDTGSVTTATTRIERSGPAIRAALAQLSPAECAQFEAEFAQATARAGAEYDLAPAQQVLDRWWGIAVIRANPLSEHEQGQLARARDGVFDGLWERDDRGDWHQL